MADVRAIASGNWSNTAIWNTGALPTSADDVWSNTFTVAVDTNATVLSIRNGSTTNVTAGGGFTAVNGVTLTLTGAGVVAGSVTSINCLTSNLTSGQSFSLIASITAGTASSAHGVANAGSGTLNITGNVTGGTGTGATGVINSGSGTVNITGNSTGGTGNNANHAINNTGTGTVNLTGTATAGSATNAGAGLQNNSIGTVIHIGIAQASTTVAAVQGASYNQVTILTGPFLTASNGTNPVYCTRWFWQNTTPPATYYQIRSANLSVIRPLYTADSVGGNPATSNVRSGTVYGPAGELTGTCAVPGASSVLSGVPVDNTTGTATISAASIRSALGLASANLDSQLAAIPTTAAPTAAAIRTELDTNSTKLANLDATVSSRSTYSGADTSGTTTLLSRLTATRAGYLDNISTAAPSAATIAAAVWASLTSGLSTAGSIGKLLVDNVNATISSAAADSSGVTTLLSRLTSGRAGNLDNLDASVSSRLASSGYTTPPTVTQVRQEMDANSTKLANLDATISSRLASASYSAPLDAAGTRSAVGLATGNLDTQLSGISSGISGLPSASAIASAVWAAASRTLTTAIDNSSTIAAAVWSYATGRTITGGTVDTLTNAPSVPSAAAIASQVRTELSTELSRIDTTVSSRLAPAGTLARVTLVDTTTTLSNAPDVPTEAEIADAVRTELAPELAHLDADISSRQATLARLQNVATTQEVGDIVEGALGD